MTKLIDIYEAAIDNSKINIDSDLELDARDFEIYAERNMGLYISREQAELIERRMNFFLFFGNGSNDYFHMVESKLQEEV